MVGGREVETTERIAAARMVIYYLEKCISLFMKNQSAKVDFT